MLPALEQLIDIDQELVRQIRDELLKPPDDGVGVLATFQPYFIAEVLTGDPTKFLIEHPNGWGAAWDYFEGLGRKLAEFYRDFIQRREQSGRKKGAWEPGAAELEASFGADAALIDAVWLLAGHVDAVLALRARADLAVDERERLEVALWEEARVIVTAARPTKLFFHPRSVIAGGDPELGEGLTGLVRDKVSQLGRSRGWRRDVVEDVTQKVLAAFAEGVVRRRLLVVDPGSGGEQLFKKTVAIIETYARDQAPPRVVVMLDDGTRVPVPPSTLRGYVHRGELRRQDDRTEIVRAQKRAEARRAHRDPEKKTLTGTELAKLWGRHVRTVNAVIARESPALGPFQRNGNSRGWRVPDRPEILNALKSRLPPARAERRPRDSKAASDGHPKKPTPALTVASVARECGVSVAEALQACRSFERYGEGGAPWGRPDEAAFPKRRLSEDEALLLAAIIARYAKPTT